MRALRVVIVVLVTLLFAYVALAGVLYLGQRGLLFPAPPGVTEPELTGGTLLRIPSGGGTAFAFHLPGDPGAPTVAFFHGNGEQLGDTLYLAERLRRLGLGFYSVEYPGYGLARGTEPSEAGIYAAAQAGLEHLHGALGVPAERVVLVGQSLGSGVAAEMAARGHGAKLALISPYTSIPDVAARTFPFLPLRLLVRDHFDTASKAHRLKLPVALIHGTRDEVIPVGMSRELARLLPGATLHLVDGAHHNDILDARGGEGMAALVSFISGGAKPD
jgi:hypothetical protein